MMIYVKLLLTIWVLILIPFYYIYYGPENFLWFSDIGLFGTLLALWLNSRLLMSIFALITLPVELIWNIDFFVELITNYSLLDISHYMFESQYPLFLRGLSLFHIIMPFLWMRYLMRWGYDERALRYAVAICWILLLVTYYFSNPQTNINWVFYPAVYNWLWISPQLWLILLMIGFPILIYWPFHIFFCSITRKIK